MKKLILLASALSCLTLSFQTYAVTLITVNNTDQDSSVRITSNAKQLCSSKAPVHATYTPAHQTSYSSELAVRSICGGSTGTCTADIYMTKDCSGLVVAQATLDLSNIKIVDIATISSKYKFTVENSKLTIDPV